MKTKAIILSVLMILACGAGTALAQDASKQQAQKAKLEKDIENLNKQLKETNKKSKNALTQLTLVKKKVSVGKKLVKESDRQIKGLEGKIHAKVVVLDSLNKRFDVLSDRYSVLVKNAYKIRDQRSWYIYILASDDFQQATRRYAYMKRLSATMNKQGKDLRKLKKRINLEKEELDNLKKDAQKERTSRQKTLDSIKKDQRKSEALVAQLKKDKSKYQAEINRKQKQVNALNRQIKSLIAAAEKARKAGKKVSSSVDVALSNEFAANKGKLPWPASGTIVEEFGEHYHPVYTKVKLPFNNGVSIAVSVGTKAKAVFEGTVQQVVVMPGYNQCVLVQHGDYYTFYCKLKSVSVHAGEKVKTGQVVGTVDTIDDKTWLHFQLWDGTVPQDPESWLK